MRFVIVTGMSGAGKSTALKMLEEVQKRVYEQSGVRLEPEVKLLGF